MQSLPVEDRFWCRWALLRAVHRSDYDFAWRLLDRLGGLMGEW
jgi:hypothetical protein